MSRPYGASHPNARLSEADVLNLLAKRAAGAKLGTLVSEFRISKTQAARICRGAQWGHAQPIEDSELMPRRRCTDPLPALPPVNPGTCAGARAMQLLSHWLGR
jgi:hypothetical protein